MHPTSNPMLEEKRAKAIAILTPLLADSINLYLRAKQAHWNVKGPEFIALHELFDKVSDLGLSGADTFGERIVQLGGQANGTLAGIAASTTLPPYDGGVTSQQYHLEEITGTLALVSATLSAATVALTALGDNVSANMTIDANQAVDKHLWFIESNLM